ncbi:MogA/MoaB family molybdenum cofactor biosynthesis protein [Natronorubrum sulfidifaciens]|uniref:Molybdenum cofactor synthesis protein n=1 Tax=Natronorubrum sulfidifaciens JCM 14089 TaxID=1230460 RepID=L9W7I2_9EURY|nr:MogA/MoaB family molybdenum cofactor biosynthesis protein [Natronorubrum sulfidifaciens]ELY44293.1 molybdenum cofactor synthesis protein [Natronorubrum sulfidifaciens JCM 14089]
MNERDERADDETTPSNDEPPAQTDHDETDETDADADGDSRSLGVGVVTVATDRAIGNDVAGETIMTLLKKDGHEIVIREHVETEHDQVQSVVSRLLDRDDVDMIVTGGATSVEPDDITIEAVEPLLEKELTAFSELFTTLSYDEVGTRVIGARTIAGVADGIPVFCLPGNEPAVRLGLEGIILPEIHHLLTLARATDDDADPGSDGEGDDLEVEGANGDEADVSADESESKSEPVDDEGDRDDLETETEREGN